MRKPREFWLSVPRAIRAPLVFMVGVAVIAAGLAMLVLPGPGWAAIFLGFAILATEFAVAKRVRDWMIAQLKHIVAYVRYCWHKFWQKIKA